MKAANHSGERLGKRIVLRPIGKRLGGIIYELRCDCGQISTSTIASARLTKACRKCSSHLRTHGKTGTVEYQLLLNAKERARRDGIPISIDVFDIVVPKICPLLQIPLFVGTRKSHDNSPSLDRIRPWFGYVKGNVRVISHRANSLKRDAQLHELEILVKNWRMYVDCHPDQY